MAIFTDSEFVSQLKRRLKNPAVSDSDLLEYINDAKRDVKTGNYSTSDNYNAQILDTACVYLCDDNKFPEIQSINQGGVSTSFASNDPMRFQKRINARRQAAWMSGS